MAMAAFSFHYEPENLAVSNKAGWVSATDGDTPTLQFPIRMLGIDAPELHYGGATEKNPGKFDSVMEGFLNKEGKNLDSGLKKYLASRLKAKPSTRQIAAGKAAYDRFEKMAKERLDRGVGKNGKKLTLRKIFIMVSKKEVFDRYNRLLAYVNAAYEKKELNSIPLAKRLTFNLQMLQEGHAVSIIIYPNIPKESDLKLVQEAVHNARTGKKGFWKEGDKVVLPYEFRWIVDTISGKRNGPDRYCADIATAQLFPSQQYYRVLPENRLFFFEENIGDAIKMGFTLAV
jgi:endonuclease YncB( thermonuclease family)